MKTALVLGLALITGISGGATVFAAGSQARDAARAEKKSGAPAAQVSPYAVQPVPTEAARKVDAGIRSAVDNGGTFTFVVDLAHPSSAEEDITALKTAGFQVTAEYPTMACATVTAPGTSLLRLAALPGVRRVSAQLTSAGSSSGELVLAN